MPQRLQKGKQNTEKMKRARHETHYMLQQHTGSYIARSQKLQHFTMHRPPILNTIAPHANVCRTCQNAQKRKTEVGDGDGEHSAQFKPSELEFATLVLEVDDYVGAAGVAWMQLSIKTDVFAENVERFAQLCRILLHGAPQPDPTSNAAEGREPLCHGQKSSS